MSPTKKKNDYGYINCVRCGERIKRTGPSQKYCKPCWIEHRKETVGQTFIGLSPRPCSDCGEMIKQPTNACQHYCSECIKLRDAERNREYAEDWRRKHGCKIVGTPMVCVMCGEEFPYSSGPQKYCNECSRIFKQLQYKRNHKFQPFRELAIIRDKRKCQICGTKYKLHVHHIDKRGIYHSHPNHEQNNLITLCVHCHSGVHWGKLECPKSIELERRDDEWQKVTQQVGY